MRSLIRMTTLLTAALVCPVSAMANEEYFGAIVTEVYSYNTADNCVHFLLSGVSQADPAVPNNGWFAISKTNASAEDAYAALVAAKVSGTTLHIRTDGTVSCGNATASLVSLN